MVAKYAISLLALLGSAAAQGYSNSSSIATGTTSSAGAQYTDGAVTTVGGTTFEIQTDTTYADATVLTLARKRQASSGIGSCLATCSANTDCVGTSYSDDTGSCQYYSAITGPSSDSPGTDFALVTDRNGASTTSSSNNGTSAATSATRSATRTPGVPVGGNNSTTRATGSATRSASRTSSSGTSTSSSAPSSTPSALITIRGVLFLIEIDISYSGITIDFAILAKRAGETFDQCLTTCAANSNCAGTSFEDGTCTFYTGIDAESRTVADGVTFATVVSRAGANNGAGNNGTAPGNSPNATAESLICPSYGNAVLNSSVGVTFAINCGRSLLGTTYDASAEFLAKRQSQNGGLPLTISNCIDLCSLAESCVGVTFEEATETCSYYSDVVGSVQLDGFDSAVRVQDNNGNGSGEIITTTTVIAGATITTTATVFAPTSTVYVGATSTAVVYTTIVSTVTVLANGVTALPSGAVVTQVVPGSTITYVNTVPAVNIAIPTVTVTQAGAAVATQQVTVTVDANGKPIGTSVAGAAAGGNGAAAGGSNNNAYPTVTVFTCPTSTPAQGNSVVWTTVYV